MPEPPASMPGFRAWWIRLARHPVSSLRAPSMSRPTRMSLEFSASGLGAERQRHIRPGPRTPTPPSSTGEQQPHLKPQAFALAKCGRAD